MGTTAWSIKLDPSLWGSVLGVNGAASVEARRAFKRRLPIFSLRASHSVAAASLAMECG